MDNKILSILTGKDDKAACALAERIAQESECSDIWYEYFDEFKGLLNNPKSLVRNRGISILAAIIKWDTLNKFDKILDEFLTHITDERPITSRQCIKALIKIGSIKKEYIPKILMSLKAADISKYKDSMRPLVEKDIIEAEEHLLSYK